MNLLGIQILKSKLWVSLSGCQRAFPCNCFIRVVYASIYSVPSHRTSDCLWVLNASIKMIHPFKDWKKLELGLILEIICLGFIIFNAL